MLLCLAVSVFVSLLQESKPKRKILTHMYRHLGGMT